MIQHLLFYFSELSISVLQITTIGSIFSVTFCQQQQKVTKERRRRCILAKNHFTTLNSREWRSPQTRAAKPRVLNASFKDFLNARLQSRHAIVT